MLLDIFMMKTVMMKWKQIGWECLKKDLGFRITQEDFLGRPLLKHGFLS